MPNRSAARLLMARRRSREISVVIIRTGFSSVHICRSGIGALPTTLEPPPATLRSSCISRSIALYIGLGALPSTSCTQTTYILGEFVLQRGAASIWIVGLACDGMIQPPHQDRMFLHSKEQCLHVFSFIQQEKIHVWLIR